MGYDTCPKWNSSCNFMPELKGKYRCGPDHENRRCYGKGRYCSKWGWCGSSNAHKNNQMKNGIYNHRDCPNPCKRKNMSCEGSYQGKNLGKHFKNPKECAKAARKIGAFVFMWAPKYHKSWGCRMCKYRHANGATKHSHWDLHSTDVKCH